MKAGYTSLMTSLVGSAIHASDLEMLKPMHIQSLFSMSSIVLHTESGQDPIDSTSPWFAAPTAARSSVP